MRPVLPATDAGFPAAAVDMAGPPAAATTSISTGPPDPAPTCPQGADGRPTDLWAATSGTTGSSPLPAGTSTLSTPAAGAHGRVVALLCGVVRLSCGLVAAPAALAVRTPPVVVPMLVAVIVTLTAWSVLFGVRTIRHGPRLPLTIVDLLLTGGACLLMPWLVAPEVIPGEVSWLAVLTSTSVIVAQFLLPAHGSVPAGVLLAAAYAVGAHWAGNDQEALGHGTTLVVQTTCAAALAYLTRRSSRAADRAFEEYRQSLRRAAVARAAREAERQQNRDLHDTVLSTLTVVGLGAVRRQSSWLRERAAADLRVLSELAAGQPRPADSTARSGTGLVALDERLRRLLDRLPELAVTASLRPCAVPADVAEAIADSTAAVLSNVVRHAPGAGVALRLTETAGTVAVEVVDDGPGFDPGAVPPHRYGLRESVRGRMAAHGGRTTIDAAPGRGTRVRLEWSRDR